MKEPERRAPVGSLESGDWKRKPQRNQEEDQKKSQRLVFTKLLGIAKLGEQKMS